MTNTTTEARAATVSDVRVRIGEALTGDPGTPLVFLGNFEVEDQWARGEVGLPRLGGSPAGRRIVHRMDEFALVLGTAGDHVVLKSPPDPGYLDHLTEVGLDLPTPLCPAGQDPDRMVTEDVLADPALLDTLSRLAGSGRLLVPHGVSAVEETLAATSGLPLATPSSATCKAVNSKIYSRRVADELGLRQAAGRTCETPEELADATGWATGLLAEGRRVVVKDAFGVSGKGVTVVTDAGRLARLRRLVETGARRSGAGRIAVVVEEWVAKTMDLNYQFTVDRDGSVAFDFVLAAVTEHGVHKGHRMPAPLGSAQVAELVEAAARIGGRLAADGYFGVVGVDAMVDPDGGLYPIVEINARHNMSTYQAACRQAVLRDAPLAWARHYPTRVTGPLSFTALRTVLGDRLYRPGAREGLLVNNFASVNANVPAGPVAGEAYDGRLYGVLVAGSADRLAALDREIAGRLGTVIKEVGR